MGTVTGSTGLTGRTSVVIDLKNVKKQDLNEVLDELNIDTGIKWSWGTGPKQANCLFHDNDEADYTSGKVKNIHATDLKGAFGEEITLNNLKLLYVKNTHATLELHILGGTTPIQICPTVETPTDPLPVIKIAPGGFELWINPTEAGLDVTENFNLKFQAGSEGTVTFDYALMGLD